MNDVLISNELDGSQTLIVCGRMIAERTETEDVWHCTRTGRSLGSDTLDVLATARLAVLDLPSAPVPA